MCQFLDHKTCKTNLYRSLDCVYFSLFFGIPMKELPLSRRLKFSHLVMSGGAAIRAAWPAGWMAGWRAGDTHKCDLWRQACVVLLSILRPHLTPGWWTWNNRRWSCSGRQPPSPPCTRPLPSTTWIRLLTAVFKRRNSSLPIANPLDLPHFFQAEVSESWVRHTAFTYLPAYIIYTGTYIHIYINTILTSMCTSH